jgi:hypothetical protein
LNQIKRLEVYDAVERFGPSKITFVIETEKPKKKIV